MMFAILGVKRGEGQAKSDLLRDITPAHSSHTDSPLLSRSAARLSLRENMYLEPYPVKDLTIEIRNKKALEIILLEVTLEGLLLN